MVEMLQPETCLHISGAECGAESLFTVNRCNSSILLSELSAGPQTERRAALESQ